MQSSQVRVMFAALSAEEQAQVLAFIGALECPHVRAECAEKLGA